MSATFLTVSSFSRMIKQTLYPLGVLLLGLSINQAQAQTRSELSRTTFETTLSNGLKVIIREDHRAPMVMTQIWYKSAAVMNLAIFWGYRMHLNI